MTCSTVPIFWIQAIISKIIYPSSFSNISQCDKYYLLRILYSLVSVLFTPVYALLLYKTSLKSERNKNVRGNISMISVKYSLLL